MLTRTTHSAPLSTARTRRSCFGADIGEVPMKALIYRRIELVAQEIGDVLLIGSAHPRHTTSNSCVKSVPP